MTTERALDVLTMSEQARWKDGIESEDVNKAVETIRKELEEVEKYKQIIEDIKDIFIDSLIFGELWDFYHDKISDDDVINEMNRVFKNEVEQAINKHIKGASECSEENKNG